MDRSGIGAIEAQFKKLSGDLQLVQHQLETSVHTDGPDEVNPLKLYKRIIRLRKIHADVSKRAKLVQERKQAMAKEMAALSQDNACMVKHIQGRLGVEADPEAERAHEELEEVCGPPSSLDTSVTSSEPKENIPMESVAPTKGGGGGGGSGRSSDDVRGSRSVAPVAPVRRTTRKKEAAAGSAQVSSRPQLPSEVSVEDFKALPTSVRGRSKLEKVQQVLDIIRECTKKKQAELAPRRSKRGRRWDSEPQTLQPIPLALLDKQGAKVTGLTGTNIISTLRKLGYISVNKAGVVLEV